MNKKNEYSCEDFYTAAILVASDFLLKDVIKNDNGKCTFIFNDSEDLQRVLNNYWKQCLYNIESTKLINSIKHLKSRIYN